MPKPEEDLDEFIDELKKGLVIDKDALDDEFINDAEIFHHITERYEQAVLEKDSVEIDIEQAEAELYIQFKKKEEGLTDTGVKRSITTSQRMVKLNQRFLKTKERVGKLKALKEAYERRGKALQKLADLYQSNYFTTESGGKRRSEVKEELADKNRKALSEVRKGRKEYVRD